LAELFGQLTISLTATRLTPFFISRMISTLCRWRPQAGRRSSDCLGVPTQSEGDGPLEGGH
jgi:hypothetical protein